MKPINTRYAPSPTGKLHVGGARTAIFNYLFAKKNHGNFILRIEDTDPQRNEETGIDSQYDNLKWLKIFPDESFKNPGVNGPYLQSQKLLTYKKIAYRLLEENLAYRCFCPQDQLVEYRKTAKQNKINPRYPQKCRKLTTEEIEKFLADQTPFVIRLKIPQDQIVA